MVMPSMTTSRAMLGMSFRETAVGMSWEDFKTLTREEFCPVNEIQKLENKFWNHAMVGPGHAVYTDRFHELARLVPHLVTPENKRIERYIYDLALQIRGMVAVMEPVTIHKAICNLHHPSEIPYRACFNYGRPGHMAKDCRVAPRMVNPINARNPTAAPGACYECGGTDHFKATCPRLNQAQRPGGNRPNQVVANNEGQGRRNNGNQARRKAFMLGAEEARQDPNIIMGIEPNELGFSYVIEIASGQLVEIDKVIRSCKLEIKEEIVMVRYFLEVFLDDLSRLPPFQEIEFRIELIPEAIPVAKSPYRLAPSDMEELSEVQFLGNVINGDGIHLDPSKIEAVENLEAPRTPSEVRSFLGLAGYYRRFIENFSKIVKSLTILTQKTLPNRPEDFMVYCDALALGLGCMLMQRGKRRWIELFSNNDCEIYYHPSKANVVSDTLSRKDRIKPGRIRAINMTLQSSIKDKILAAQERASDKDWYWWSGMKKDIAVYQPEIPEWKWERIAMDFVTKLRRTSSRHDTNWVIVDRLTKSAHFLPMREDYKMDRLARLYLNEIVARHDVPISIISDCDSRFTSSYPSSVRCASFEALYGRKYRSPIMWAEVREGHLIGHDYADKRRKPLEFSVGEHVSLKVSPWKGVVRFGKKGKLAPRFVRPFEITKRIGPVAYRLRLPEELNGIHDTFHVSNRKKCSADPILQVSLDEIQVDAKLNFVEERVETLK
ncbi:putative reverse transcriptase domain-containing protein [Tanacetum coccineum]